MHLVGQGGAAGRGLDVVGGLHAGTVLVDAPSRTEFALQSVASTHNGTPGQVEVCAALTHHERDDKRTESAVSRLSFEPSVISVRWQVDEPGATEQKG